MKFLCPKCKEVIVRDMRSKMSKHFYDPKKGYRSMCKIDDKNYWCKEVKA